MGTPDEFAAMLAFINRHGIEPVVDQIFKLDDAADAFRRLQACEQMGKLVLVHD